MNPCFKEFFKTLLRFFNRLFEKILVSSSIINESENIIFFNNQIGFETIIDIEYVDYNGVVLRRLLF
jgi:hypothetical protein